MNWLSASARTFSCVIFSRTFAAKTNPFGVFSYQPRTVPGLREPWNVLFSSTVSICQAQ